MAQHNQMGVDKFRLIAVLKLCSYYVTIIVFLELIV